MLRFVVYFVCYCICDEMDPNSWYVSILTEIFPKKTFVRCVVVDKLGLVFLGLALRLGCLA